MHQELHTPDSVCSWVRTRFDGPGWELFRKSADVGPFACSGEVDCLRARIEEYCDLFGCENGRDEDEAVAVEGLEVRWLCHCLVITWRRLLCNCCF